MDALPSPSAVVGFWRDAGPKQWFAAKPAFDAAIRARFEALVFAAAANAIDDWANTAEGALARILALDQFPRNLHRDSAHAFAADGLARAATRDMLDRGFDLEIAAELRPFAYLPLTHSEAMADQLRGVALLRMRVPEATDNLRYARLHADVIRRFGRFPHRNAVLGRITTPAEQAFLEGGGFAG